MARRITTRKGWTEERHWKERSYAVRQLPEVIGGVAGEEDVYFSIQRFNGWRRIVKLRELSALAIDLDYYRVSGLEEVHPLGILEEVMILLEGARIPAPSLPIASGRGLDLLWLFDPVPRRALPRWNAAQKYLYRVLRPLGADRVALDSARLLRAIGTRNSRSGRMVEALLPVGEVWAFDTLCDEVLPVSRAELHALLMQKAARRPTQRRQSASGGFTAATLWEARLTDLQELRRPRWSGPLPPGQRDLWLFIAGVGMSWLAPPEVLERELLALAWEVGGWHEREAKSRMHAIIDRAKRAACGERIDWQGESVDPRYRMTSDYIVEALEITPAEERRMITLISADERRRRDRKRKDAERRKAGMMTREEYEHRARDRRAEAVRLHSEGLSNSQIAETRGISKRRIQQLLKEAT